MSNKNNNNRNLLNRLNSEVMMMENYIKYFSNINNLKDKYSSDRFTYIEKVMAAFNETKTFSTEELERFNGKDGNPSYIAVEGIVYDVTNNEKWTAGTHFGLGAGRDLTTFFTTCHSGSDILKRLPVVGNLI